MVRNIMAEFSFLDFSPHLGLRMENLYVCCIQELHPRVARDSSGP